MKIGACDSGARPLVIAEIGNNHEGSAAVASELVRKAADCKVDVIKFQVFRTDRYISRNDPKRFAQLKRYELAPEIFIELAGEARSLGLGVVATALDRESAIALAPHMDGLKIASGDLGYFPLVDLMLTYGKPLILSTGLSDLKKVAKTIDRVRESWGEATPGLLAILHCVSAYPAPPEQANLSAIQSLKTRFGVETGYSDHTIGITAAIAAVAMGARIIEKHFTLANDYSDFRDHQLSADPGTMTELVERVRQIDIMLGDGVKAIQPNEVPIQAAVARSLAVNFDREAGDILLADDVSWVRCGNGVPYGAADPVGKRLTRKVSAGASLSDSDFE